MKATFIAMFNEPINSYLNSSIIARAHKQKLLQTKVESIFDFVGQNHHKVDDTPYGGGAGELIRIDVIAPLLQKVLQDNPEIERSRKRVILLDPGAKVFKQAHAKSLAQYDELIFICGRYEGIDARIHHYVDEVFSLGDFVLSAGDLAAMAVFDATVRMIPGVLGNFSSIEQESYEHARLEYSQYTRPAEYEGLKVPEFLQQGNHAVIEDLRTLEAFYKTKRFRPDLLIENPPTEKENSLLQKYQQEKKYIWCKNV